MSLRVKLAEHGFESNEDYEHALRCLFHPDTPHLRVLHVDGSAGRRKTAFAQALARALDIPHVLYHDFSQPEPPRAAMPALLDDGSHLPAESPLPGYERALIEACAFSEAERAVLILDQLQNADFAIQSRLYHFVMKREWSNPAGSVQAHVKNFLLMLVSEQPLYHSLAKCSFRVWTDAQRAFLDYRPADYRLGNEAQPLFDALGEACLALDAAPTPSEFGHLLDDLLHRARSEEQIRQSFYGRVENVARERLQSPELLPALRRMLIEIERLLGADEVVLDDSPLLNADRTGSP